MQKKKRNKRYFPKVTASSSVQSDINAMQEGCKMAKKVEESRKRIKETITYSEEDTKEIQEIKDTIVRVSKLLIQTAEKFIKNEDYRKYASVKDQVKLDENGEPMKDEDGEVIHENVVEILESSFIKIDEVGKSVDIITKVTEILQSSGILTKVA